MIPLTLLGRFWGLLSRLGSLAGRYPVHCALVASLGLCWLSWQRGDRYRDKLASTIHAYQTAQREAQALAIADRAKWDASQKEKANAGDQNHKTILADPRSSLAAYIDAGRVRPKHQSATSQAPTAAQDPSPAVPAITPADTVLAQVSDLKICDANYAYAKAAHEWALVLGK